MADLTTDQSRSQWALLLKQCGGFCHRERTPNALRGGRGRESRHWRRRALVEVTGRVKGRAWDSFVRSVGTQWIFLSESVSFRPLSHIKPWYSSLPIQHTKNDAGTLSWSDKTVCTSLEVLLLFKWKQGLRSRLPLDLWVKEVKGAAILDLILTRKRLVAEIEVEGNYPFIQYKHIECLIVISAFRLRDNWGAEDVHLQTCCRLREGELYVFKGRGRFASIAWDSRIDNG